MVVTERILRVCGIVFLLAFWIVGLLFRVELIHYSGASATLVCLGLFLGALVITGWLLVDSLGAVVASLRRKAPFVAAVRGLVVLCVMSAGPAVHVLEPDLPFQSFLSRNESRFLEHIRTGSGGAGVEHYTYGSAFRYSWRLPTDGSFFIVYEPDRSPDQQLLGRDTDAFYPGGNSIRHLRGPWYSVVR